MMVAELPWASVSQLWGHQSALVPHLPARYPPDFKLLNLKSYFRWYLPQTAVPQLDAWPSFLNQRENGVFHFSALGGEGSMLSTNQGYAQGSHGDCPSTTTSALPPSRAAQSRCLLPLQDIPLLPAWELKMFLNRAETYQNWSVIQETTAVRFARLLVTNPPQNIFQKLSFPQHF